MWQLFRHISLYAALTNTTRGNHEGPAPVKLAKAPSQTIYIYISQIARGFTPAEIILLDFFRKISFIRLLWRLIQDGSPC